MKQSLSAAIALVTCAALIFPLRASTAQAVMPKNRIAFAEGAHRVIAGWELGFEGMRVGGRRRLFIPYQLGYGAAGRPPVIPVKSELIFDVELMPLADPLPREPAPVVRGQPAPPAKCPTWAVVSGAM